MHMWWSIAFNEGERILIMYLAHGTRARSAHESQNCAILSINCPFTGNSAFWLCVNDIVVDLPVERTRPKSLFAKLTQLNTLSIRFCRLLTLVKLTCYSRKHTFSSSGSFYKHYKTFTDHCPKEHPL